MPTLPSIRQFMDTTVHTLHPNTELLVAIQSLLDHHVTGAPVVSDDGELLGILTELDCLKLLAMGSDDGDSASGTVAEYMTKDVYSVPSKVNIYFAAGVFLGNTFRRLPVVENGKLIGAITRFDILRAVAKNHDLVPNWSEN